MIHNLANHPVALINNVLFVSETSTFEYIKIMQQSMVGIDASVSETIH